MDPYIAGLEISHNPMPGTVGRGSALAGQMLTRSGTTPAAPAPPALPARLDAAVNVGSLLSFVDGLDAREKEDTLFSQQLAQRVADKAHDRVAHVDAWYASYLEVLHHLGWVGEHGALAEFKQAEGEFRMDKAALSIIGAIATQNQLLVLKESLQALSALAEGDGTIRLFDFHSSSHLGSNFQIGAVQKSAGPEGALSLALGAFHCTQTNGRRRFLFFAWGGQDIRCWTAAHRLTLNPAHYALVRDSVRQKLAADASDYISALRI